MFVDYLVLLDGIEVIGVDVVVVCVFVFFVGFMVVCGVCVVCFVFRGWVDEMSGSVFIVLMVLFNCSVVFVRLNDGIVLSLVILCDIVWCVVLNCGLLSVVRCVLIVCSVVSVLVIFFVSCSCLVVIFSEC